MYSRNTQRGVVLPSPVVLISIVALVMAAAAFFLTRGESDDTVAIPTVTLTPAVTPSGPASDGSAGSAAPAPSASSTPVTTPTRTAAPVKRSTVKVVVFNNTRTKGLAATVSTKVTKAGWKVVGADNWYGSVPRTTVYYPAKLKAAGKQLALDLGIKRTAKAEAPMSSDRLTLILTGPLT